MAQDPSDAALNGQSNHVEPLAPTSSIPPPNPTIQPDTVMPDAPSPMPAATTPAATPHAPRTSTPARNTPQPSAAPVLEPLPTKATLHGAPARRYLNEKVTAVLLEGMKRIAAEQFVLLRPVRRAAGGGTDRCTRPEDPLRVLGEFLIGKSQELEGTKGGISAA